MIKGIYLDWDPSDLKESSREYYDHIDLDDLDNIEPFHETREFWPASWWLTEQRGGFVRYNVEVDIQQYGEQIQIIVKYKEENNEGDQSDPNLQRLWKEIIWGTNKIIIERGKNRGKCEWTAKGKSQPIELYWERKNLYERGRRIRPTKQQIRDERFRDEIIDLDRKCVVSGETTAKALDAAHIIPVKDDGNEIPENGIALRADIHRLYDDGMFAIDPESGKPEKLNDKLSEEYKKILTEGCLPGKTLERVREALKRKEALDLKKQGK